MIIDSVSTLVGWWNARAPVASSYRMAPNAKWSARKSAVSSGRLFRRHVADRPQQHALGRSIRRRSIGGVRSDGRGLGQPRQPEVHDLDVAFAGKHDVLWLQIAMHDTRLVRLRQGIRELGGDLKGLLQPRPPALQLVPKGRAFDDFHHDIELAVALADVVDRDDARMIQRGQRSGFLLETPDGGGAGGRLDAQDLDGDIPAELRVPGAIDLSHAAGAEQSDDLVWAAE